MTRNFGFTIINLQYFEIGKVKAMKKRKLIFAVSTAVLLVVLSVITYAATAVRINDTRVFLHETDTVNLKLLNSSSKYKVEWSSSDKSVATVSSSGLVTAKKEGTATIYAKYRDKKYSSTVRVSKYWTEKGLKSLIKKTESSNNWKDGTALKCLNKVPYRVGNITVNEISVKKYHYTGTWFGTQQKYKYLITVKGSYTGSINGWGPLILQFTRSDGASTEPEHYYFTTEKTLLGNSKFTKSGKNFTLTVAQYNIWCDFDEFFIYYQSPDANPTSAAVSQNTASKSIDIASCGTDPNSGNIIIKFHPSGWDGGVKSSSRYVNVDIDGKAFSAKATVNGTPDADGLATITVYSSKLDPADGSVITVNISAGLVISKSGAQESQAFCVSVEHVS